MPAPTPRSRADIDPNFELRLRELRLHAALEFQNRLLGQQVPWYRPGGYEGNLADLDAMAIPFDSSKANNDYIEAVKDSRDPGTTGDVVATTTMMDFLAVLERAFRNRHTLRRPRATAHLLGRKLGHGSELGPIIQNGVEYIRNVLKQAKVPA